MQMNDIEVELADRLAMVADMVNNPSIGPDSSQVDAYIKSFQGDAEFVRLAELSRRLKRSFAQAPASRVPAGGREP